MGLTSDQRETFVAAIGFQNCGAADRASAVDNGLNMMDLADVVSTHETVADFQSTHREGREVRTPFGALRVWSGVQLGRGKTRGELFLMDFGNVRAAHFTGQA